MSINYIPDPDFGAVSFLDLRIATIEYDGFEVDQNADNDDYSLCLTDGTNHLWAYGSGYPNSIVHSFTRYGNNNPENIINCLSSVFGCELIDEYSERYYELLSHVDDDDEEEENLTIEDSLLAKEYYSRNRTAEE